MKFLSNLIIPSWVKYVALAGLVAAVWGHGYVRGMDRSHKKEIVEIPKIIYKQGKVTEKVVYKYIKQAETIKEKGEELKKEGQSYAIKFPDDNYIFNNLFVSLYDSSITGAVPSLSGGEAADPSGVGVSEVLSVSVNNNTAGRMWEQRAKSCEAWVAEQEKATNGN